MDLSKIRENGRAVLLATNTKLSKARNRPFEIYVYVEEVSAWLDAQSLATYLRGENPTVALTDENGDFCKDLGVLSMPPV